MERTLIGVFDSEDEARAARQDLAALGIDQDRVHVRAGSLDDVSGVQAAGMQAAEPERHRSFFDWLFGNSDADTTHADQYAEAVRRGSCLVVADGIDEAQVDEATDIMARNGAIDIDARVSEWRSRGWTGYDANAPALSDEQILQERERYGVRAGNAETASEGETTRIPVVEEQLAVGKRTIERGGVRVYTRTTERPVEEEVTLREERARVERHPVDRPANEADLANAFKEGTVEVRESAEEAVVSKTAQVVEEVEIGKDVSQRTEKVSDTVRRTDVEVEDLPASRIPGADQRPPANRR